MKFTYRAFEKSGRAVSDVVEASSATEAQDLLRRQGLFVSTLAETAASGSGSGSVGSAGGTGGSGKRRSGSGKSARLKAVAVFVRQLAVLVSTGTPMVDALSALERPLPPGDWKDALADIRRKVEEGSSLSAAMTGYPKYFDAVALSLIAAGESGGKLDSMLKRLAVLTRQQMKVRASIIGAMTYPCLLLFVCFGVLSTMLFFVLPRFEGLFETLGAPLPPTTKMLMDLSAFLRSYWYIVIGLAGAAGMGAKLWASSDSGVRSIDRFMVNAPQVGKVVRALATARMARVLGVLVEGRVPLLDALKLTRESSGNTCYEALIGRAEELVTRGESVSAAFADSPLVPRSLTEAIRSGERSGQLGTVLNDIAEFLDEDNEVVLRSLSSLVEPVILIVLGVIIGFVAVSMFLPLFDLATAARGGGGA